MHALSKLFEALHLTRKGRLSGGHYRRRRQTSRRSSFLSCETLESKQLLAADVAQSFANVELDTTGPVTVAIEGKFQEDTVSGTVVKFDTNAPVSDSDIYIELAANTPLTNANFLSYVNNSAYDNTMFHRSVNNFVLQGGGFTAPTVDANQQGSDPVSIPTTGTVNNEPGNLNIRGTIAMAKLGDLPDSATSQFFFNLNNNSFLDSNNGGYTVFGEVLGSGMSVVDTMALQQTYDATTYYANTALGELPLYNTFSDNIIRPNDFLKIENADVVTESDLMTYVVESSDTAKLTASFDGNGDLVLTPVGSATGSVDVTVTATSKLDSESDSQTFSVQLGSTLTAIETAGNTILNGDEDGRLYVGGTAVMSGSTHVAITTFAGYEIVAAEAEDGVNKLLLRRTDNNALHAWTLDAQWSRTGADGGVYAVGNSRFYDYESLFGIDVDGGGAGQAPLTAYESNGSIVLQQDGDGKLYVDGTAIMAGSTHATITTFAGYEIIAAEAEDGVNKLLLRRTSTNALHAWTLDAQWNRTGADGGVYAPGNSSFYDYESLFGIDVDGGGAGQAPLTAYESNGSIVLQQDGDGKLYVDGTAIMAGSTHATITTFAGYEIIAAEAEDGVNKLLLRRTSTNALHAWTLDAQWNRTGADGGVYAPGNSSFYDYESLFGIDVDGGGAGQAPLTAYESNGSIVLQQDGDGKLYVDGTAIMAGSTHATITTFAGYEIIAAEAEDGVNKLLLRRTSINALHAWTLDAQWNRTGADGGVYAPGNSSFYDYEALFGIDVDGGGAGQAPLTAYESNGSIVLQQDGDGKLYVDGTAIMAGSTHATITTFAGYEIIAAEAEDGVNKLLLRRTSTNALHAWTLDAQWNRTGADGGVYAPGNSSFYDYEALFGFDANNDGISGTASTVESNGSFSLVADSLSRLYVGGTAIMAGSTHVAITTFAGYEIIAAEAEDDVNKLLLRRTSTNALHAWTLDAQWNRTGADGGVYAPGNSSFYDYEALFGIDVDGNGEGS